MASLRDSVKDYQEELRDGIAWLALPMGWFPDIPDCVCPSNSS